MNDNLYRHYISMFLSENWIYASQQEKTDAFQLLENTIAEKLGREAREIIVMDLGKYKGQYDPIDDVVRLNEKLLNSNKINLSNFRSMETFLHENQHIYQHDVCKGKIYHENTIEIEDWKKNSIGYLEPQFYNDIIYRLQPLEKNSFELAAKGTDDFFNNLFIRYGGKLTSEQFDLEQIKFNKYVNQRIYKFEKIINDAINLYGSNYEQIIKSLVQDEYLLNIKNKPDNSKRLDTMEIVSNSNQSSSLNDIISNITGQKQEMVHKDKSFDDILNNIVKHNSNNRKTTDTANDDQSLSAIINNIKTQAQSPAKMDNCNSLEGLSRMRR